MTSIQNTVSREDFAKSLTAVSKPLGTLKSLMTKEYRTTSPAAPNGEYVLSSSRLRSRTRSRPSRRSHRCSIRMEAGGCRVISLNKNRQVSRAIASTTYQPEFQAAFGLRAFRSGLSCRRHELAND